MSALCFILAFVGVSNTYFLLISVFWMNLTTAIQDVAVDTFALSLLKASDLGRGSTYQVVGYKVGVMCGSGLLAWLRTSLGWQLLFCIWGSYYIIILTLLLFNSKCYALESKREEIPYRNVKVKSSDTVASHSIIKNKEDYRQSTRHGGNQVLSSDNDTANLGGQQIIRNIIQTPGFLWLFAYLLIYKMGEQGVVSMLPLFMMDQGIPHEQVVVMSGIFGQLCSISGSMIGGWIAGLHDGQRSWVMTSLQYVSCARLLPIAIIWLLSQVTLSKYSAVILECFLQIIGGIITTKTFTLIFLSAKNSPDGSKASHSAVLATAEVLGKLSMIAISGMLVDIFGYQRFFGLCLILALLVIPVLKAVVNAPNKKTL
ncbi:major facilitator superfamily domain-containing protein 3-like [Montipora foliosa]|uniref:major facilitator superfamily domain-containing protein 3-like n=1 Tax=Montipora foliosa TaxID=591990 RepID=UPI0035F18B53